MREAGPVAFRPLVGRGELAMKAIRFLGASALAAPVAAFAAVPEEVETAITAAGTDGAAVAVLVLIAVVGIYAVMLMRRAVR